MADLTSSNAKRLTADIVTAYLAINAMPARDVPSLIGSVHAALGSLDARAEAIEKPAPAVSIRKSVTPDYLISLEDGRRYKALTRHLRTLGMTPEQYRGKWGLARDYPMVAPEYAKRRSELAKAAGLGRKRDGVPPTPAVEVAKPAKEVGNRRSSLKAKV